jgi:hypothetical protein
VWEMAQPARLSPRWLAAASARERVVVVIVPPGTWPSNLPSLAPAARADAFTARLRKALAAGQVLHATARLVCE